MHMSKAWEPIGLWWMFEVDWLSRWANLDLIMISYAKLVLQGNQTLNLIDYLSIHAKLAHTKIP